MMKRGFMKRLSKSATDLSGCTKKTHTTSPDEEKDLVDFPDDGQRDPDSIIPLNTSTRSKSHANVSSQHQGHQPKARAGMEIAHYANKSKHGFLQMLRQKLTRVGGRGQSRSEPPTANVTPEVSKRRTNNVHAAVKVDQEDVDDEDVDMPVEQEVVKLHPQGQDCAVEDDAAAIAPTELPMALSQELEMAKLKEQEQRIKSKDGSEEGKELSLTSRMSSVDQGSAATTAAEINHDDHVAALKSFSLFLLHVHLKQGFDLAARDANGTSDPYVKFVYKGKVVHKSKTINKDLNPYWDEHFVIAVDDPFQPVFIKVFDYDWAFRDDFMGESSVHLSKLEFEKNHEILLSLSEPGKTSEYLGQIALSVALEPKRTTRSNSITSLLSNIHYPQFRNRSDSMKRATSGIAGSGTAGNRPQTWTAVVNVVLIEGRDLLAMDLEGTSDPYCKFRLGNERYKSKPVFGTLNPRWLEQFDLSLFPDQSQEIEITVWDKDQRSKDDFMGRCSVGVSSLPKDRTVDIWKDLEDGAGQIHLLVTVSGLSVEHFSLALDGSGAGKEVMMIRESLDEVDSSGAPSPLSSKLEGLSVTKRREFSLGKTFVNLSEVGALSVKLFCAKGLYAADLGGKSDPYAVIELDNQRVQTHTEYKTISPTWNRIFFIPVLDINSTVYVTVYDEDRNHSFEFLGKIAIPLLRIEPGRKRWFALKDKKLRCRAKGPNPQILVEFDLVWNPIRASVRTLNPKEEKFMQVAEKFKRQIFLNNVMRIKAIIMEFVHLGKFIESCLEWEHPVRSAVAFVSFLTITYYFQPYMVPIGLLLIFLKNYIIRSHLETGSTISYVAEDDLDDLDDNVDDLDDKEEEKEEKKSLKARLQAIQEVTAMVQNALGYVASLGEEVKNTFNFSVPYLSWLAIVILFFVALILYFISLRFLVLVWGINKFTKKLIRPNYVPNNELLDFLSRVPDDEALLDFKELRMYPEAENLAQLRKAQMNQQKKKQKQS